MIETLLPPLVSAVDRLGEDADSAPLPEEESLMEGAVAVRRAEFATARACAREALRKLGLPPGPILRGAKREPLWPTGIVGSITHCTGYRAAAVARADQVLTIGIDAEPHAAIEARVTARVLDDEERAWIASAPAGVHWDRLIFSAKESVYKAWFPLARRWLGFEEARLAIDPGTGVFEARLLVEPPANAPHTLSGRYLISERLVITAIAVMR
jgi:4'-phosphopantetheinyl transferase EntD